MPAGLYSVKNSVWVYSLHFGCVYILVLAKGGFSHLRYISQSLAGRKRILNRHWHCWRIGQEQNLFCWSAFLMHLKTVEVCLLVTFLTLAVITLWHAVTKIFYQKITALVFIKLRHLCLCLRKTNEEIEPQFVGIAICETSANKLGTYGVKTLPANWKYWDVIISRHRSFRKISVFLFPTDLQ